VTAIANIRVDSAGFLLPEAFEATPDASFEVPPVAAHAADDPFPFVVATGVTDATIRSDPTVADARRLAPIGEGALYRITWETEVRTLLVDLLRTETTMLSVRGVGQSWRFRLLVPSRTALAAAYSFLTDSGVSLELDGIHEFAREETSYPLGLSEQQYTALLMGLEHGFYDVPRTVDTVELAAEIGITHQALSERLRRAHARLVENALASESRVFN
jgi:predicted DNA binding protein